MPASPRPRRSVLYMPGSNARALEKAREIAADALILDLEDAVVPERRPYARVEITQWLASAARPVPAWVRINAVETDDATGLASRVAPVRLGGSLDQAAPAFWS